MIYIYIYTIGYFSQDAIGVYTVYCIYIYVSVPDHPSVVVAGRPEAEALKEKARQSVLASVEKCPGFRKLAIPNNPWDWNIYLYTWMGWFYGFETYIYTVYTIPYYMDCWGTYLHFQTDQCW